MPRISYAIAGALLAACLGAVAYAQQPTQPPFVTTRVDGTENVYIFRGGTHQSMFVVTTAGVIATDPIGYAREPIDPATARVMAARRPRSVELTPVGLPAVRALVERFIAVGFSKFVLRPIAPPSSWRAELETLSAAVGDLQT